MDFKTLDLVTAAEQGSFCQLHHPVTEEPLIDADTKEPVGFTVLGVDSKTYQSLAHAAIDGALKEQASRGRKVRSSMSENERKARKLVSKCVTEVHHVELESEAVTTDEHSLTSFFARMPWAQEQVEAHQRNRGAYLGE